MTRVHTLAYCLLFMLAARAASPQGTTFTYQGKLADTGSPANGNYDIRFTLFDLVAGGTPQGAPQTVSNVTVASGTFTVSLDFGACASCFDGSARFLEIAVKPTSGSTFTILSPRQQVTANPYAIRAATAAAADGLSVACVSCVTGDQIGAVSGSVVTGAIPVAAVPAGSGNYVQNQNAGPQPGDFKIGGTGTANIFDATTQYNLGGNRLMTASGATANTLFVGLGAGGSNTTGIENAFVGALAGANNTTQFGNTLIGAYAGQHTGLFDSLSAASGNTMVGTGAGVNNTTGGDNVFIGYTAGVSNSTGGNNTMIGTFADFGITPLTGAAAIGARALVSQDNSMVLGQINGVGLGIADTLVGIGTTAPTAKLTVAGHGAYNTNSASRFDLINTAAGVGYLQHVSDGGLWQLATTAGATRLVVDSTGNIGIGTPTPQAVLNVSGTSWFQGGTTQLPSSAGQGVSIGYSSGLNTGALFAYDYTAATPKNLALNSPGGNVGIGTTAPTHRLTVSGGPTWTSSAWLGSLALDNESAVAWRTNAGGNRFGIGHTNGGLYFFTTASDPGTTASPPVYQMAILDSGNVGIGTGLPQHKLSVLTSSNSAGIAHTDGTIDLGTFIGPGGGGAPSGFFGTFTAHPLILITNSTASLTLEANGLVQVGHVSNAGTTAMCFNASLEISLCSSSLRYKTNLAPYRGGLEVVSRLRPISFDWIDGGLHDVGFGAEDVEQISPLLVTYNQAGQVEGVKYDRLSVVFVNAIREQEAEIGSQQREIQDLKALIAVQQVQLDGLRTLVCVDHPEASACK